MKITMLQYYYGLYIQSFYRRFPEASSLPYHEQLECLLDDKYHNQTATALRLVEAGHDVQFIVMNAGPLQRAWAREHGISTNAKGLLETTPLVQIEQHRPDVVWMAVNPGFYEKQARSIKQMCRRLFRWLACPLPADFDLSPFDCIFTSNPIMLEAFRAQGKNSELLLPAFEPRILDDFNKVEKDIPVSFIGQLSSHHGRRYKLLKELVERVPIRLWGFGFQPPRITGVRSLLQRLRYRPDMLTDRFEGDCWGLQMYDVLARSKISFNVHIDVASGMVGNIRMFEATGMGALLFSEAAPNASDLFRPGREIITYSSVEELVDKIEYYLDHESERAEIAAAGQSKTLNTHNTVERGKQMISIFERYL